MVPHAKHIHHRSTTMASLDSSSALLSLGSCRTSGAIPSEIGKMATLRMLNLTENRLTGKRDNDS